VPNLSVLLNATLSATDTTLSPSATIVTRNLNNPTLSATVVFYDPFFQAAAGGSVVTLPAATVWIVYVKNLDAAANLTVSFTPTGGGAETCILVPGGVFLYFQPTEGAGGITALTLTASAGTISTEVLVAK
jgi:hypothetical protein